MFNKIIIRSLWVILTAIYSFLFAVYLVYGYGRTIWDWDDWNEGILVILSLFLLIFLFTLLFISIVTRILKKHNFDINNRVSIILLVVIGLLLIPVIKDSPPVKNDYTLADLKVPSEKAEESYEILKTIFSDKAQDIELNLPDDLDKKNYSNVTSYKKEILDAWNKIYPWRRYIEQPNSYSSIADLTEPYVGDFFNFSGFRKLTDIYRIYAILQVKEGNVKEGIKALTGIHSVVTKSLPFARYTIHNIIWAAIAEMNIQAAYIIASDPVCSDNDLRELKEQFPPLLNYDKPFSNMFMSEYIFAKYFAKVGSGDPGILVAMFPGRSQGSKLKNFLHKNFFAVLNLLTYKENRTLQDLKKYYTLFINSSQKYQDFSVAKEYMDKYTARPHLINSSGWMVITIESPDFQRYLERMMNMAVKSDLLVLYIDSRLGNKTELIDRFNRQKYQKGKEPYQYFSAGIDGLPGTKDDINLN
jgi:hypothetical protein